MQETNEKVLAAAARSFAKKGYRGASIRQICADADVSSNAIHYHFGNKEGLYRAVLNQFGGTLFRPLEAVLKPANNHEEFVTRLRIYMESAMQILIENKDALEVLYTELSSPIIGGSWKPPEGLTTHAEILTRFLAKAQGSNLVDRSIDVATVTGLVLERLANQVRFADMLGALYQINILDETYLNKWIGDNLNIIVNGIKER